MADTEPLLAAVPSIRASVCKLASSCHLSDGSKKADAEQRGVIRRLWIAGVLCFIFMIVEVVGGYWAHSIAILSDAAHMLSDVAGFAVSIFAAWAVTQRSHDGGGYTFGYHRAEIIGALASVMVIWGVTGALLYEGVRRLRNPEPVDGRIMFYVATAGIVFNIIIGFVLGEAGHTHGPGDHSHDHGHGGGACGGHAHGKVDEEHGHAGPAAHDHSHAGHSHAAPHDHSAHSHAAPAAAAPHDHSHAGHSHATPAAPHDHSAHGHSHAAPAAAAHDHSHAGHSHATPAAAHDHSHAGHSHAAPAASTAVHVHDHGAADAHDHGHSHGGGGGGHSHNINLRSAVLHVLGDLVQSIGVAIAGALIWYFEGDDRWLIVDPICTLLFATLVLLTTRGIMRDVINTLMERVPEAVDIVGLSETLHQLPGVADVHDLHVWNLSLGIPILTAHVHVDAGVDNSAVLLALEAIVRQKGIHHSTIQICNANAV